MIAYYVLLVIFIAFIAFSLRYHWWRFPISHRYARVLMYHAINEPIKGQHKRNKWRVKPHDFEQQMQWLSKHGWKSFTLSELISLQSIPEKSFVLTFDDGFEDNFSYAFPILKKFGFKATIYLTTDRTCNDWEKFQDNSFDPLLRYDQIKEMSESGLIEFGSHTKNHMNLERCDDGELVNEIRASKTDVERMCPQICQAFAYPYGKYNDSIEAVVKESGYSSAVVVKRGIYKHGDNPYQIHRIGILGTESFFDFYLRITRVRNKI